jgi:hypothetical protein
VVKEGEKYIVFCEEHSVFSCRGEGETVKDAIESFNLELEEFEKILKSKKDESVR